MNSTRETRLFPLDIAHMLLDILQGVASHESLHRGIRDEVRRQIGSLPPDPEVTIWIDLSKAQWSILDGGSEKEGTYGSLN